MIIEVLSQEEAIEYAGITEMRTSIISITSKEDEDVSFPENPNIVSVLHMNLTT